MAKPAVMTTFTDGQVVDAATLNSNIRDFANEAWKYTTLGDLMYALSATTATKLGIGSTNQFLQVIAGVPAWRGLVLGRKGGNATDWSAAGTTNFTPTNAVIQCGSCFVTLDAGTKRGSTTVTFPSAFSNKPLVFVTPQITNDVVTGMASSITSTNAVITVASVGTYGSLAAMWMAIGPG